MKTDYMEKGLENTWIKSYLIFLCISKDLPVFSTLCIDILIRFEFGIYTLLKYKTIIS